MALMAAIMPGFGDPRQMPIDDFFGLMAHASYARAIASGQRMSMGEAVTLEAGS